MKKEKFKKKKRMGMDQSLEMGERETKSVSQSFWVSTLEEWEQIAKRKSIVPEKKNEEREE